MKNETQEIASNSCCFLVHKKTHPYEAYQFEECVHVCSNEVSYGDLTSLL